jgi:hypothetical protein
VIDLFK